MYPATQAELVNVEVGVVLDESDHGMLQVSTTPPQRQIDLDCDTIVISLEGSERISDLSLNLSDAKRLCKELLYCLASSGDLVAIKLLKKLPKKKQWRN